MLSVECIAFLNELTQNEAHVVRADIRAIACREMTGNPIPHLARSSLKRGEGIILDSNG